MQPPIPNICALATAAINNPTGAERDQIVELLIPALKRQAEICWRRWTGLTALGSKEDLIQQFLTDKLLPPDKLRIVLRPVAAGKPNLLLPRVQRSFVNFLISLLRRPIIPTASIPLGTGKDEIDPPDRGNALPAITERLQEQLEVIRQVFPSPEDGAPHGAALRLDERLRVARLLVVSFQPDDDRSIYGQPVGDVVETLLRWTSAEAAQNMPTRGMTLDQVWATVRHQTQERPHQVSTSEVASILGISADVWHQWLKRARNRLVQRLGSEQIFTLFPNFPVAAPNRGAERAGT